MTSNASTVGPATLQDWQQCVIKLKVLNSAAIGAELVNQIPGEHRPDGLNGRAVRDFLAQPKIAELVARMAQDKPQQEVAA